MKTKTYRNATSLVPQAHGDNFQLAKERGISLPGRSSWLRGTTARFPAFDELIRAAKEHWTDADVGFDADPVVNPYNDGAWVQAWVRVPYHAEARASGVELTMVRGAGWRKPHQRSRFVPCGYGVVCGRRYTAAREVEEADGVDIDAGVKVSGGRMCEHVRHICV